MKTAYSITPSWLVKSRKELKDGVKNLSKLGFKLLNEKFVKKMPTVPEKVKQLHKAFSAKGVDLVLAQRGGYGSMKLLPYVNFDLIRENPKTLAGFSDLSTLLNSIYERTGLTTLHSPMVWNFSKPAGFTVKSFMNAVNGFPEKNLFKDAPISVYKHGKAKGTLKGGNLVTLAALIGTEWDVKTAGTILFLEDVDEKLHKIDRCITQWVLCGKFKGVGGLILGDFRGIKNKKVYEMLADQMKVNFPVVHCPYIGHVKNKITLPVGAKVELDTKKKTLILI
jgi:muramoyltetrapeptide carboxypeptidase